MLDKYAMLLFEEYKNTTGYDYNFEPIQDDFYQWLKQRKKSYKLLACLFNNMPQDRESLCIAEIGKGKYDTIIPEMKKIYDGEIISVTPFKDTFSRPGFKVYNGKLDILNDNIYVRYDDGKYSKRPNCSYIYNNKIDTIMTTLPISNMHPYDKLFSTNKTIMIGKSGFKNDLDRDEETDFLFCLARSINNDNGRREIEFDYQEDGKYYATGIKVYTKK